MEIVGNEIMNRQPRPATRSAGQGHRKSQVKAEVVAPRRARLTVLQKCSLAVGATGVSALGLNGSYALGVTTPILVDILGRTAGLLWTAKS
jgi:hypothetical protein